MVSRALCTACIHNTVSSVKYILRNFTGSLHTGKAFIIWWTTSVPSMTTVSSFVWADIGTVVGSASAEGTMVTVTTSTGKSHCNKRKKFNQFHFFWVYELLVWFSSFLCKSSKYWHTEKTTTDVNSSKIEYKVESSTVCSSYSSPMSPSSRISDCICHIDYVT